MNTIKDLPLYKDYTQVSPFDTCEQVLKIMKQNNAKVCLVANGSTPLGVITSKEILEEVSRAHLSRTKIGELISLEFFYAKLETRTDLCFNIMKTNKLESMIVLDRNKVKGIILKDNLIKLHS